jgi:uncharacterized membrane protein YkvA (DUF1232 family)
LLREPIGEPHPTPKLRPERSVRVRVNRGNKVVFAVGSVYTAFRFAFGLRRPAFRALRAMGDRRVPGHLKLLLIAATIFVLSPLNILGDLPLLGFFDDAGLLALAFTWFSRASAPYINTIDF